MHQKNKSTLGKIARLALLGMCWNATPAHADATLVYQTVTEDDAKIQHTFAISGRFVRVDSDAEPDRYQVIDAGLLTMADVDQSTQRYSFEKLPRGKPAGAPADKQRASDTPGNEREIGQEAAAAPSLSPEPVLVPTRKKQNVSGIICRVVTEVVDDQPLVEHCMAGTGALGMTSREMVTLSRLFTVARRLQLGWVGVATADERIASIDSHLGDGSKSQTLLSVSYENIPDDRMQVSKQYKRVDSLQAVPDVKHPDAAQAVPDEKQPDAGSNPPSEGN